MIFIGKFFYSYFSSFPLPPLRPYQLECIEKSLEALSQGITRQAVSLPVGSGKTVILSNLISKIPNLCFPLTNDKGESFSSNKVLILIHREELIQQIFKQVSRYNPSLKITIERGILKADHSSDVIIASVPTLGRIDSSRLDNYNPELFKAIIIDEAHHGVAESYMRIINHFTKIDSNHQIEKINAIKEHKSDNQKSIKEENKEKENKEKENKEKENNNQAKINKEILIWGCSATFSRNDNLALGSLFQKIIYHLDFEMMIEKGFLSPVKYFQIFTEMDLTRVENLCRDYDPYSLSLAINTPKRNKLIVEVWKRLSQEHSRRATIVFGLNIRHVEDLKDAFRSSGIDAHSITSQTEEDERREILEKYSQGKIPVIVNCAVLTEGTDLPITDCILLTKPTCNSNLYIQMIGRGLRLYQGKEYCLVLDVIDKDRSPTRSLISFPNLMMSRKQKNTIEDEENKEENKGEENKGEKEELVINKKDSIKEFKENGRIIKIKESKMDYLNIGGRLAWVGGDPQHYLLSSRSNGNYILTITQNNPILARVEEIVMDKDSQTCRTRKNIAFNIKSIIEPLPMTSVIEEFEEYLEGINALNDFSVHAGWRRRSPPSPGQVQILHSIAVKLGVILATGRGEKDSIFKWTMGKASNVISKFILMKLIKGKKVPFESWEDLVSNC